MKNIYQKIVVKHDNLAYIESRFSTLVCNQIWWQVERRVAHQVERRI